MFLPKLKCLGLAGLAEAIMCKVILPLDGATLHVWACHAFYALDPRYHPKIDPYQGYLTDDSHLL
jgi:hypothetical protein